MTNGTMDVNVTGDSAFTIQTNGITFQGEYNNHQLGTVYTSNLNETYNNLSELLNLLLYIKEDAKGLYFNEHEWLFLSYVSANLAEIMMITEGVSKISRIGA